MCKVSVLMPVYNAEKYLAEAIDSIINQTFTNWELVVINDGSTDSSKNIIENYKDNRIQYIENNTNIGLIKTLNKGITLCQGEYIARMDADDIAHPNRLKMQVFFLDTNSTHVLVGSNATVIDNAGNTIGKIINPSTDSLLQISLLFTNPIIHPSVTLRKATLKTQKFDEAWAHIEDYELWIRLAKEGKLANLKDPLLKYRWHDTNVSVKHTAQQEKSKDLIIKEQLKELDIEATQKEIDVHKLTFNLYSLGNKKRGAADKLEDTSAWFKRLIQQNNLIERYPKSDFEAFLWSRWIVLCISKKRKRSIISPPFISFSPTVIYKTIKLAFYLSKK